MTRHGICSIVLMALFSTVGCHRAGVTLQGGVEPITIERDGLALVGDLYLPAGRPTSTAILLLHGSSSQGRSLVLYPELARRFAGHGYIVLNLDQRAYGESDDPSVVRTAADLDFVGDAEVAIDQLLALTRPYGVEDIACVGHSFGGGVAVMAGLASAPAVAMVSVSPGRRMTERFFAADARDGCAYVRQRKSADMGLEHWIPEEVVRPMLEAYNIEQIRDAVLSKPFLMIEGANEPEADLRFSRELVATLGGPVKHVVIPGAGHYFGTAVVQTPDGKAWQVVDEPKLAALTECIVQWLASSVRKK